jgi:8-oxo-dGTP pyrophosphatase MutT (NUDIX family)
MKKEVSCGGVVAYKSKKGWLVLLMKDHNDQWTLPKGKIEKGEERLEAAIREIAEEVGVINISLLKELTPVKYWYNRNGSIRKEVIYYLFSTNVRQKPVVQKDEGITEAKWVPIEKAVKMIGYPKTNAPVITEVTSLLQAS